MILVFADGPLSEGQPWAVLLLMAGLGSVVAAEICILRQPQNKYVKSSSWKQFTLVPTAHNTKKTHEVNISLSCDKNVDGQKTFCWPRRGNHLASASFLLCYVKYYWFLKKFYDYRKKLSFMAPCVPLLPSLAMFFNIYLMLKLPGLTWARLGIWICIGECALWYSNQKEMNRK